MNAPIPPQLMAPQSAWLERRDWPDGKQNLSLMDRLFNRLDGAYPNLWRAAFKSESAIENWREAWAEAFVEEGITPNMVKIGVTACRKLHDMPPSLTQFLRACRPQVDHETAYREACEQMARREDGRDKWSQPTVYWTAVQFGHFELRNTAWTHARARWTKLLDDNLNRPDVPPVPPSGREQMALPAPGQSTLSREDASRKVALLREGMCQVDHEAMTHAWVKVMNGQPTIAVRNMALRALRNLGVDVSRWEGAQA